MSRRAKTIANTQFAAALLAGTVLAGLPVVAAAQDNPAPAPDQAAPAPAPDPVPAVKAGP